MGNPICPKCGNDLTNENKNEESDPSFDGMGVSFEFKCGVCGKEFEDVYTYSGIWDPEKEEYVYRS